MRAELTQYAVAGWGEGELWTRGDLVLAHDFRFVADAGSIMARAGESPSLDAPQSRAGAPLGGSDPPSDTVAGHRARESRGFVNDRRRRRVLAEDVVTRIGAFLAGRPVAFGDIDLDVGSDTPFQRAVTTALRAIPRGEVVTYAELAALAGHPGAQRAVGTFCAQNRFMFLLPCHRVVGAGGIGAYGSAGVAVKRRLLALEGTTL